MTDGSTHSMVETGARFLTPTDVANLLMVSPITVRQWAQKGMLRAHTTAGGHRRFQREEIERFARERGIELPGTRRSVLIVDDDRELNSDLVALFATEVSGSDVFSAFDGFEAGRLVQQYRPAVVLLDLMVPGLEAVQACRSIKDDPATAHARVIGMTGHYTPEVEHRILDAGASALLKKPFATEELLAHCGLTAYRPA